MKRRVLIVEDNRDAREMLRTMLELDGHEVLEAEEGRAGLQLLRTAAPDIALIDVGLPGIDGYEIAHRFRSERAIMESTGASCCTQHRVLLVALTGYGTPDALERSRRAGFDHHVTKPVNPEVLYKLLSADGAGTVRTAGLAVAPNRVAAAPAARLAPYSN